MIVRIMGEGQYDVPDALAARLNELDNAVLAAVEQGDEEQFRTDLAALLGAVRGGGAPVPDDALVPSDATLPFGDATVEDVRALLGEQGLIPG